MLLYTCEKLTNSSTNYDKELIECSSSLLNWTSIELNKLDAKTLHITICFLEFDIAYVSINYL